jgi:hypothetical protein
MNRLLGFALLLAGPAFAQDARQIVAESQNRSRSKSQRYEGTLEVIAASNKVSLSGGPTIALDLTAQAKLCCASPRRRK